MFLKDTHLIVFYLIREKRYDSDLKIIKTIKNKNEMEQLKNFILFLLLLLLQQL